MASRREQLNAYTFAKQRILAAFVQPSSDGSEEGSPKPLRAILPRRRIEAQARRGHEIPVGLVGGCALASCAVLYTGQVAPLLAAGLGSLVLLGLGLALAVFDVYATARAMTSK